MATTGLRSLRPSRGAGYPFVAVILAAVALRFALLVAFGPRHSYDSIHEYAPFAELIRHGTRWVSDPGLADTAVPLTTFRMIGYPALIALAQEIARDAWPWLLICVQIAVSMVAIVVVMLLARALDPARWVTIAAGLSMAFGQTLQTDTAIQTDSIAADAFVIFSAISVRGALQCRRIGPLTAVGLGLLPAASFLLRADTDIRALMLVPFAVAWIVRANPSSRRRLCLTFLVIVPLIAANSGQLLWNAYRTGGGFLTTGTQIILLQSLMHAAWTGEPVLDRDGPIDRAAKDVLSAKERPNGFIAQEDLWAVNQRLFDDGSNAVQISSQMIAAYASAWSRHPFGMIRASIKNLSGGLLFLLGNSVQVNMTDMLFGPPGLGEIDSRGLIVRLILCGIALVLYGASFTITVSLIASPLAAIYRAVVARRPFSEADWFRLAVLIVSLAFLWFYAMVHFEARFLAPIEPLAIVSGLTGVAQAWRRFDRQRGRREGEALN